MASSGPVSVRARTASFGAILILAVLSLATPVLAQDLSLTESGDDPDGSNELQSVNPTAQDDIFDPAGSEVDEGPIEELTVYGDKSIGVLRRELLAAENAAFEMFNDLNDDNRFDFVCKREVYLGSQIPVRQCLPRAYRQALSEVAEDGGQETASFGIMTGSVLQMAREKMAALANEHPEFRAALQKRLDAKRELEAARKRR